MRRQERRALRWVTWTLAIGALVASACGGDDTGSTDGGDDSTAGNDGGGDASSPDTGHDATTTDGPRDGTGDSPSDSTVDAANDSANDAASDATSDATNDSTADAPPDVTLDSPFDSPADSPPDSPPDAPPDSPDSAAPSTANVLGFHKNPNRDGFYYDPALTKAAVATMHLDPGFNATTSGQSFSQPLFMENAVGGADTLFVATENDDVFALNAATGAQLWMKNLGAPVARARFCGGSIDPLGSTGTPVLDAAARRLFVAAMVDAGGTPKHMVYSLSIDDGSIQWSVDVSQAIQGFDSTIQNERGALALVAGNVYVPYGGLDGDCGNYKGWVIAIPENNPSGAKGFATPFQTGPGIWGVSGVASDGTSIFVATCNTNAPYSMTWDGTYSEAILRLGTDLSFSKQPADYFAPTDWYQQDQADTDFGSSGVVLFDAPGASHKELAFGIGKTSTARLVDRTNMGGISDGLSNLADNSGQVFSPLFAYTTANGTYVGGHMTFNGCAGGDFSVLQVNASSQLQFAWCASSGGDGGPISSSTSASGSTDSIVWSFGAAGDNTLRAWDADTGAAIPIAATGVGGTVQHWTSPIIAKGRIYVAADGTVYAFRL